MFSLSSINNRIILGAIIVISFFMVLTAYTLNKTFYTSAYSALEERLTAQVYLLMADRELNPSGLQQAPQALSVNLLHNTYSSLSGFVTQSDGTVLWKSTGSENKLIPPIKTITHGKKMFQTFTVDNKPYIGLSIAIFWDPENQKFPLVYHITDDLSDLHKLVSSYQKNLLTNLLLMAILLLSTVVFLLRLGLKPLRDVENEIKAIEQGRQDVIEHSYPDELQPLTVNINQLINFERQQKQRYRHGLDDLAHSLKTPLAIIKGQHFTPDTPDLYVKTINDAAQRMNNIVEYQLQRASMSTISSHIQFLKLSPVIQSMIDSMKKIYRDKTIHFNTQIEPDIEYKIDEGDFMEVLGNLLDNACKWCQDTVFLNVSSSTEHIKLVVSDNGPGIDVEKINVITSRGFRADQLTPGHGVGLAIVQDIVASYSGSINISSKKDRGLEVTILFNL